MSISKIILARNTKLPDLLEWIKESPKGTLILSIKRDCEIVMSPFFGKKIKKILKDKNDIKLQIIFITQKKFFQSLLKKQGFEVQAEIPQIFSEAPLIDLRQKSIPLEEKSSELEESILEKDRFLETSKDQKDKKNSENQKHPKNYKASEECKTSENFKNTKKNELKSSKTPKFSAHKIEMIQEKSSLRGFYFFLILSVIGLLIGLLFWISPKAVVTIKPKISIIPITQNIIVMLPNAILNENDENLPRLTGILNETLVQKTQKYPSTKKTYEVTNARGKLTLYNETATPKFLIPSRLQTNSGLIFRMQESATIPPKSNNIPGRVTVTVVADEQDINEKPIGSRGNILAGETLFFPALRKNLQELYYAKTDKGPLVGGSTLTHHFVGEEDFELAKPLFQSLLVEEGQKMLIDLIQKQSQREGKYYILLDEKEALLSQLSRYNFNPEDIGKEKKEFEVSGELKISGIVFNQDEVIEILKKKLEKSQDTDKELVYVDPNSIQYRVLNSEDLAEKYWVKLTVSMQGIERLSFKNNSLERSAFENQLKKDILGKSTEEAKSILVNNPQIKSVQKIQIHPFWKKKLPPILDQIQFKIEDEVLPEYKPIYHSRH